MTANLATNFNTIRKNILKRKGVTLQKKTKRPVTQDDVITVFTKTRLMQYVELKHSKAIDIIIWEGTIDEVAKKYSIDRSTVSKWRTSISEQVEANNHEKFFKQFKESDE